MSLLDILNDRSKSIQINERVDKKLASREFWKDDEKKYLSVVEHIAKEHKSIRMSQEKYHAVFYM